jgi:hypothetical protein
VDEPRRGERRERGQAEEHRSQNKKKAKFKRIAKGNAP